MSRCIGDRAPSRRARGRPLGPRRGPRNVATAMPQANAVDGGGRRRKHAQPMQQAMEFLIQLLRPDDPPGARSLAGCRVVGPAERCRSMDARTRRSASRGARRASSRAGGRDLGEPHRELVVQAHGRCSRAPAMRDFRPQHKSDAVTACLKMCSPCS